VSELPDTERRHPRSAGLGAMSAAEVVALMDEEEPRTLDAVRAAAPAIARAAEAVAAAFLGGGTVVLLGSGTSGRLAVGEVAELGPTFGVPDGRFAALVAGGADSGPAAIAESEDDVRAIAAALGRHGVGVGDVVIGLAASGTTPFVLAGVRAAGGAGATTGGIASTAGTALLAAVDVPIHLATGPELLTGSTRLKAGTAQKLALNRITTAAMVLAGRVAGNHMVDVVASVSKLEGRAARIVADLAGVPAADARALLAAHGWRVRDALAAAGVHPGAPGSSS
jgi:N-acetylmuramic acid 6-phosphate etherase